MWVLDRKLSKICHKLVAQISFLTQYSDKMRNIDYYNDNNIHKKMIIISLIT